MGNKTNYVRRGQEMAGTFSNLADDILAFRDIWWDRAYNSGGTAELIDADVATLGVTASDVTGMITFADALEAFLIANRAYLSRMRSDL